MAIQASAGSGWRNTVRPRWRACCRCCTTPAAACWPPWTARHRGASLSAGPLAAVRLPPSHRCCDKCKLAWCCSCGLDVGLCNPHGMRCVGNGDAGHPIVCPQKAQIGRRLSVLTRRCAAGKSGLVAAVAHALSQNVMCRTHVVWIRCGEIETETLGKAKAHLLPLVNTSAQGFSPSASLFRPCCGLRP